MKSGGRPFRSPRTLCTVGLALAVVLPPAAFPQGSHYNHKQVRHLLQSAKGADDYQKLAGYFRTQELLFRDKAQNLLQEFALHTWQYPMAAKTVSRVDVVKRSYNGYLSKADENAKLAERYERALVDLGLEPDRKSTVVVSVNRLKASR